MRYKRTHTVFFNEDDLEKLREECTRLTEDFSERSTYLDKDMRQRAEDRLSNLRIAIDLLGEEAD